MSSEITVSTQRESSVPRHQVIVAMTLLMATVSATFFFADSGRNWAVHADQELTLAYNAIAMLDGGRQETYDHTGFFTMYLLGKYIQLRGLMSADVVSSIAQINTSPVFGAFQALVTYAREFAAISSAILLLVVFFGLRRFGLDLATACLLSVAYFFSTGSVVHFEQLRTEPLSVVLLCISGYFFSGIGGWDGDRRISRKLLLSLFFLVLAMINKIQVFIFSWFYFFGFILLRLGKSPAKTSTTASHDRATTSFLFELGFVALLAALFSILLFVKGTRTVSILMIVLYLIAFSVLLSVQLQQGVVRGLRCFELRQSVTLAAHFSAALFLAFGVLYPVARDPLIFHLVVNPSNIATYLGHREFSWDWLAGFIVGPLPYLTNPLATPLWHLSCAFVACLIGWRSLDLRTAGILAFLLASYYFVELSSSFRSLALHYKIYSEFFLFLALAFCIRLIPARIVRMWMAAFAVLISAIVSYYGSTTLLQPTWGTEATYCNSTYIRDWHQKIDYEGFLRACRSKGLMR